MKQSIVRGKSFEFAIRVVKMYQFLYDEKKEFVMSKQVLRSGTSIGANVREALNAESTADFIHKLAIAQKEADETLYWLELLHAGGYLDKITFDSIYNQAEEVYKIITKIIITSKQNSKAKSKNNSQLTTENSQLNTKSESQE
jgi:four helix bundle protein